MKTLLVIQARMGSTRLPGKVLLPMGGRTLLERMVERVRAARTRFELCVATTLLPEDDWIAKICRVVEIPCFRGHPTDLLDRHFRAACERGADTVLKIPSDCPLIDPQAIDRVLGAWQASMGSVDFMSNLRPPSWPDGNDIEVMSMATLEAAWKEATRPLEREHTTPFIWERPERFRLKNVFWETGLDYSGQYRLTVDYPEDYAVVRRVFEALYSERTPVFSLGQILSLLSQRPDLRALNQRYLGQSWHRQHLEELKTVRLRGNRLEWSRV